MIQGETPAIQKVKQCVSMKLRGGGGGGPAATKPFLAVFSREDNGEGDLVSCYTTGPSATTKYWVGQKVFGFSYKML